MDVFEGLNSAQVDAVKVIDGPMMIIAGAGSGKTKVLTHRTANLINNGVDPFNILALTFTNKAAKEMKHRISSMVGFFLQGIVHFKEFFSISVYLIELSF